MKKTVGKARADDLLKDNSEFKRACALAVLERQNQLSRDLTEPEMVEAVFYCLSAFGTGMIHAVRNPKFAKKFVDLI
jgi:hypothetical protein